MKTPIYLALDFPDWKTSERFLSGNDLSGIPVKVGMELFYKEGPAVIEKLKSNGHEVFLDLKLHDIPNTVKQSMKVLASLGVDIVNVHASGGSEMISAAKEGLEAGAGTREVPKLLGVTVLTSFDSNSFTNALQTNFSIPEMVLFLARQMKENGGDGIVCSSWEAKKVKQNIQGDFLVMCPGIRLTGTASQDQKRIATPEKARLQGAGAIVIGRSITAASQPYDAWKAAEEEWSNVFRTGIN